MGEFCSECSPKYNRCWCFKSGWEDNPVEVEIPLVLTETNKTQQLTMTVMPKGSHLQVRQSLEEVSPREIMNP